MNSNTDRLMSTQIASSLVISLAICFLMLGCSSTQKEPTQPKGPTIHINSDMMKNNSSDVTFWLSFALAKTICGNDYPPDSFGEFSCAFKRAYAISLFSEEKPKENKSVFQAAIKSTIGLL